MNHLAHVQTDPEAPPTSLQPAPSMTAAISSVATPASPAGLAYSEPGRPLPTRGGAVLKRTLDLIVAGGLLLLLAPLFALAALTVRLESPGPVFYRCRRVGHGGSPLAMLKFRKMQHGAAGLALTTDGDGRFTRIGALLARTKLDELPQLWQVFRGQMSLVGPRPEDPDFVSHHQDDYKAILSVRPGITGLSQIAFAEEGQILDDEDPLGHYLDRLLPQKVAMDRMYAEHRSLRLDLRILFWTSAAVILRRKVAVHRQSGRMNLRRR